MRYRFGDHTSVEQLLNDAEIFNLNLPKLASYIEQSKLAQKVGPLKKGDGEKVDVPKPKSGVESFLEKLAAPEVAKKEQSKENKRKPSVSVKSEEREILATTGPLLNLTAFLNAITNGASQGRILVAEDSTLKFVLLNPSSQFADLVTK